MGFCCSSTFYCAQLCVHFSFAIILMGCLAQCVFLVYRDFVGFFLAVPWACLLFVIVVFPDHNHFLFLAARHISASA